MAAWQRAAVSFDGEALQPSYVKGDRVEVPWRAGLKARATITVNGADHRIAAAVEIDDRQERVDLTCKPIATRKKQESPGGKRQTKRNAAGNQRQDADPENDVSGDSGD